MSASKRIPESFIESVIAKTDIVSLIQESLKLKKMGTNYTACCPFHHEKTPSFSVSQTKQFYHCFGCKAHGNVISFIMEFKSLPFIEALEYLASRLGLSIPHDNVITQKNQIKLTATPILNKVAAFFESELKASSEAVNYLKNRHLTGKIAKAYGLGFAPNAWDRLLSHFKNDPQAFKILEETGLIIKHPQGRYYDRFRKRIMFPIRDRKGDVLGFGGRVLDKSNPKYLNSPESPLFQKGHCLYGLYETVTCKKKWDVAIIVEGYFDVVMLAQHGIYGAFATLGTALTNHHLSTIFHLVSEVVFCFDGDNAGQAAAYKALQLVLPFLTKERMVRFAFLPQGEDPDSYIRHLGKDNFLALIKNSTPLSEYFFAMLFQKVTPNSTDNRAYLASQARPMLEQIPAGIFKEMMYEELAKLTSSSVLTIRGNQASRSSYLYANPKAKKQPIPRARVASPAFLVSALLITHPSLYEKVKDKFDSYLQEIDVPGIALLRNVLMLLNGPEISSQSLRQQLAQRGFTQKQVADCEQKIALLPAEGLEAELIGALCRLNKVGQEQLTEKLLRKAKEHGLTSEEKQHLREILQSGGIKA